LYTLTKTEKEIEDETSEIYAVEEDGVIICDFTTDMEFAESIIRLLNENAVESNHVMDVIEDLVYS
jgi:hypothetical protein